MNNARVNIKNRIKNKSIVKDNTVINKTDDLPIYNN